MADVDPRQLSTVSHSFTLLDFPTAIWLFPDIISESHPDCGVCEEIAFGRVSGICFDMFWHVTWNRGVSLFPGCPCVNPPSPSLSSQATPFKHCEATSRSKTLHFMMIKVLGANCLLSNTFQTGFKPSRRALLKYKSRNREQAGQRWDCPLATRGWCTDARKYPQFLNETVITCRLCKAILSLGKAFQSAYPLLNLFQHVDIVACEYGSHFPTDCKDHKDKSTIKKYHVIVL